MDLVDPLRGDLLCVIEAERAVTAIVGDARVADVRAQGGPGAVRDERTNLVEYNLVLPAISRQTAGVLALVCNTLAFHDIRVVEAATCGSELLILVHESDARRTFQALMGLTRRSMPPATDGRPADDRGR